MQTKPQFPFNVFRARKRFIPRQYSTAKAWVIKAITEESRNSPDKLWKGEPSAETISEEQLKRLRFLRKHEKSDSELNSNADFLELCEPRNPCCSGACPQCSRLFQRFYVRQSRKPIQDIIAREGKQLIGICIIPSFPLVRPGQLKNFSIANFQRRIKAALDTANVKSGIGGVDFSSNEDRDQQWQPFICPHIYLIASTDDREKLRRTLKMIFQKSVEVHRPIKLPLFKNNTYRRSYSLKMIFKLRISYYKNRKDNPTKKCRNTSNDKLRVDQRIELYRYLHQI